MVYSGQFSDRASLFFDFPLRTDLAVSHICGFLTYDIFIPVTSSDCFFFFFAPVFRFYDKTAVDNPINHRQSD